MSVEIKKDITTVTVEVPKTGVAIENAITNINVQVSQPQLTISQAGVSGRNGTSGTSGTSGNVLSSSFYISGSIIPNVADGDLTSSFSLGSSTNAWKDLWISKGTIYFIGDNNESASISINEENQIVISDINLSGSITASLAEGYLWVGGPADKNIAIPTASLITGGSGTSGVDGTSGTSGLSITGSTGSHGTSGTSGISPTSIDGLISGSQQIYDLGFIGTSQAIVDTGSLAITGSNYFSGSQYITSGGLVFNNGVQLYEDDSDLYIQSLSEIRVGANGNNYKFGNDGNFYTSVGGVVFGHDGLINQIPGASGDNINIVVGINDSIVLTTDAGDGDYAWDFDNNGDLTVPGNIYGATNLATNGGNIFNGNQIIAGTLLVSGSSDFDGGISITGSLNVSGSDSTIILPNHSTAPSTPSSGALYFNTTNFHFYGWDGGQWKQLDN
jgi:hypothetical protein